jgi:hypothetical protein
MPIRARPIPCLRRNSTGAAGRHSLAISDRQDHTKIKIPVKYGPRILWNSGDLIRNHMLHFHCGTADQNYNNRCNNGEPYDLHQSGHEQFLPLSYPRAVVIRFYWMEITNFKSSLSPPSSGAVTNLSFLLADALPQSGSVVRRRYGRLVSRWNNCGIAGSRGDLDPIGVPGPKAGQGHRRVTSCAYPPAA